MPKVVGDVVAAPIKVAAEIAEPIIRATLQAVVPVLEVLIESLRPALAELGKFAGELIREVTTELRPAIKEASAALKDLGPLAQVAIGAMSGNITDVGSLLGEVGTSLTGDLLNSLGSDLGPLRGLAERWLRSAFGRDPRGKPLKPEPVTGAEFSMGEDVAFATAQAGFALSGDEGSLGDRILKVLGEDEEADPDITLAALPALPFLAKKGLGAILWTVIVFAVGAMIERAIRGDESGEEIPFAPSRIWKGMVEGFKRVAPQVIGPAVSALETLHGPLEGLWAQIGERVSGQVRDALNDVAGIPEENLAARGGQFLARAISLGVTAHAASTVLGVIPGFKHTGLTQVPAFLADMAAFGGIARATVGQTIRAALERPSMHEANALYQSELPGIRDILSMVIRRRMSPSDGVRLLRKHGLLDDHIDRLLLTALPKPGVRQLVVALEDADVPEEWVGRMLRDEGFEDEDIGFLLEGIKNATLKSARAAVLSASRAAYREGTISLEAFRADMRVAGFRPEAVTLLELAAARERGRDDALEALGAVRDAFRKGFVTPDHFKGAVQDLGFTLDKAELLFFSEDTRQRGRLFQRLEEKAERAIEAARRVETSANLEAFRRGALSIAELRSALLALGTQPTLAEAQINLARQRNEPVPRLPRVRTREEEEELIRELETRAVETSLRRGLLTADEAELSLIAVGVSPDEARARVRVQLAISSKPPDAVKPKKLTAEDLALRAARRKLAFERFRREEIRLEDLRLLLIQAGTPQSVAEVEAEREDLALTAKKAGEVAEKEERERTAGARAEKKALLEAERLKEGLQERVLREEEALTLEAVQKGLLTPEEAVASLVGMGIPLALAKPRVERAALRGTPSPP